MSEISLQEALKRQDLRFYKKSIDSNIIEKFSENLNRYAENVNEAFKRGENEEKSIWFGRRLDDLGYFYKAETYHEI